MPQSKYRRRCATAFGATLFAAASGLFFLTPSATAQALAVNPRKSLPPAHFDSFVHESKDNAELIYGDEGGSTDNQMPPYELFTQEHRIDNGIDGRRDRGLTTGRGSYLPDAWGRDEFLGAPEWSISGARGSSPPLTIPYKFPAVDYTAQQFPTGYNTLDWLNMLDEVRARPTPLPLVWNQGDMPNPVQGAIWVAGAGGAWTNQFGDTVFRDGSILYGADNSTYPPGTYLRRGEWENTVPM